MATFSAWGGGPGGRGTGQVSCSRGSSEDLARGTPLTAWSEEGTSRVGGQACADRATRTHQPWQLGGWGHVQAGGGAAAWGTVCVRGLAGLDRGLVSECGREGARPARADASFALTGSRAGLRRLGFQVTRGLCPPPAPARAAGQAPPTPPRDHERQGGRGRGLTCSSQSRSVPGPRPVPSPWPHPVPCNLFSRPHGAHCGAGVRGSWDRRPNGAAQAPSHTRSPGFEHPKKPPSARIPTPGNS